MTDELDDENAAKRRLQALKDAREASEEELSFVARLPTKHKLTEVMLEKIPLLNSFLKNVDGTGATLSKMAVVNGSHGAQVVATGFDIFSVLLAIFDLIRIPIMFLAAWYLNVKLPFTLSYGARLIYSALILGFALAAVFAPAVALPIIGIASATFGLAATIIIFGRLIYKIYSNAKSMKETAEKIPQKQEELERLQSKLKKLVADLDNPENEANQADLEDQLIELGKEYFARKEKLQKLHDKQGLLRGIRDTELGLWAALDKSLAMVFAAAVLAGAVTSLFFLSLGVAIVSFSLTLGTAYFIGRTAFAIGNRLDKVVGLGVAGGMLVSTGLTLFFPPLGMGVFAVCMAAATTYLVGRLVFSYVKHRQKDKTSQAADVSGQSEDEPEIRESTDLLIELMAGKEQAREESGKDRGLRRIAFRKNTLIPNPSPSREKGAVGVTDGIKCSF